MTKDIGTDAKVVANGDCPICHKRLKGSRLFLCEKCSEKLAKTSGKEQMMRDTIYRDEAIEIIKKWFEVIELNPDILIDGIVSLPSADRPQGEWIISTSDHESICSVCGEKEAEFIYGTEMWYGLGKSKFCPSCGARTKGVDDEDL